MRYINNRLIKIPCVMLLILFAAWQTANYVFIPITTDLNFISDSTHGQLDPGGQSRYYQIYPNDQTITTNFNGNDIYIRGGLGLNEDQNLSEFATNAGSINIIGRQGGHGILG